MPKLSHAVPKYRKHRGSGQAVVTLSGRDHYLGPHGTKTSKGEYDRLVKEWLAGGRSMATTADPVTVAEVMAAFLKWGKTHYRDRDGKPTRTLDNFRDAFVVLRRLYGRKLAADFGPLSLEALQLAYIGEGLSRRTVNDRVACVRRMFKWAVSKEMVPDSLHHALQAVAGLQRGRSDAKEMAPVQPVADAVVDATLAKLPATVADMVRLQLLTGMRPAEVCIVRPGDVETSGEVWTYTPGHHKTEHHGRGRVVAIGPKGQAVLRKYLLRPADAFCFAPADSERKRRRERHAKRTTPINCGNRPGGKPGRKPRRPPGESYSVSSYRRAITRAAEAAGVDHWHPHQLRHSAGTAARKVAGLEGAQCFLGHAQARVTEIYAERDLAKAVEVARLIG